MHCRHISKGNILDLLYMVVGLNVFLRRIPIQELAAATSKQSSMSMEDIILHDWMVAFGWLLIAFGISSWSLALQVAEISVFVVLRVIDIVKECHGVTVTK